MGLQSKHVHANNSGFFVFPKSALQIIDDHHAIYINLSNNQFAMRYIDVVKEQSDSLFVAKNIAPNDSIVITGTDKLKTGVLRKYSNQIWMLGVAFLKPEVANGLFAVLVESTI